MPTSSITKEFIVKDTEAYLKLLQEIEDKTMGCNYCSGDYHQEIEAYATRFHSSGNQTTIRIPVEFCPNCGRKLS